MGTTVVDVGGGVGHSRGQESLCHTDGCRGQGEGRFCGINDLEVQDIPEEFTKHTCNSTMHQLGKIVELTLKIISLSQGTLTSSYSVKSLNILEPSFCGLSNIRRIIRTLFNGFTVMIIEGILCFIMFYNVFQDIYLLMSKTYKIHKTKATTDYNFTVCGLRFCDG